MNQKIKVNGRHICFWLDNYETGVFNQAVNVTSLPFVKRHVAIMPDAHTGYGVPIGCVFGTKNVVIPNAVGVDIGCGMSAVKIDGMTKELLLKHAESLKNKIVQEHLMVEREEPMFELSDILTKKRTDFLEGRRFHFERQIGTLGGGNHFIEFQEDEYNRIWLMVHSGSRNLGHRTATHYNKLARQLNENFYSTVNLNMDLAFLPTDSQEGQDYIKDMQFCVEYARVNRRVILMSAFTDLMLLAKVKMGTSEYIDCCHNYVALENHMGHNLWTHRKGATSAKKGELGIIPGSQGTQSYIVEGRGNVSSFTSCSHGAGRMMSRTQAKAELNLDEQKKILDDQGIIHSMNSNKSLDEAPGAYKDITQVMKNQEDLVKIVHTLKPIMVIKG